MFDSFLRSEVKRLGLPGLAVSITQNGQKLFAAGYGHCDPACQKPITPDTLFGIASATKLVTAIETIRLQERNQLSLNDPVNQYYPDLNIASDARMQLRHLLSHSSGLPGLPSRFYSVNLQNKEDSTGGVDISRSGSTGHKLHSETMLLKPTDLPDFINKLKPSVMAPPGDLLNYSNESFCLLGGIIEKLTAEPYQQRVMNSIFEPLNMAHSVVGNNALQSDNYSLPLERQGSELRETGIWDAPLFYPAGGILSSARDLTRLLSIFSDGSRFLSSESRRMLLQPVMPVASRPDTSISYSYGLEYQYIDGDQALHWHTGQRAGISSFIGWVSGSNIAISVLSNIANPPVAVIGFSLINKLLKRTDVVWPQLSDRNAAKPKVNNSAEFGAFQGRYFSREGFDFQVKRIGTTLFLIASDHSTQKPFNFIDKQSGIVGEQTFRFLLPKEADTTPWALALDLRILPRAEG